MGPRQKGAPVSLVGEELLGYPVESQRERYCPWDGVAVGIAGPRASPPVFQCWLCHLLATYLGQVSSLLCVSFLFGRIGTETTHFTGWL